MNTRQKTPDELFCYFVGLTRGMVTIEAMTTHPKLKIHEFTLTMPKGMNLPASPYIQLNGVLFEITSTGPNEFRASSTFELMQGTNLLKADIGHQLSIGVLARHESPEFYPYLVHPSASTTATVYACGKQPGHKHTIKIDFECDEPIPLEKDKHLGINGSTLLVQEVCHPSNSPSGLQRFSIYAGKQTRDTTILNGKIKPGTLVNITHPYEPEKLTVDYPQDYKNPSPF